MNNALAGTSAIYLGIYVLIENFTLSPVVVVITE